MSRFYCGLQLGLCALVLGLLAAADGAAAQPRDEAPPATRTTAVAADSVRGRAGHDSTAATVRVATGMQQTPSRHFWSEWLGRPPVERAPRLWQRHKSARVALLSSFLVPGLGQLYNERELWAVAAAGVELYFVGNIVTEQREINRLRADLRVNPDDQLTRALIEVHRDNRIQSSWLLGLSVLLSGLQSFVDAHLADFDTSPPQVGLTYRDGPAATLRLHF